MIYLICTNDGNVLNIVKGESFEEVYDEYVSRNVGEFIVELNDEDVKEIVKLWKETKR